MPEGHLLHRSASELTVDLAGCRLDVSSPQRRLDPAEVDGAVLRGAEAYGKHLLLRFEDAPVVHVHLGMRGLFLRYPDRRCRRGPACGSAWPARSRGT